LSSNFPMRNRRQILAGTILRDVSKHQTLPVFFVLTLIFMSSSGHAQTGQNVPELAAFDTAMNTLMKNYQVPGGQLAIIYFGKLVYNRGFGYADTASKTLVLPDNIFRLASVSKPITSAAIMKLLYEGKIRLGDTVFGTHGILNDTTYKSVLDPRVHNITVHNLLNHSAGWNRDISGDPMFNSYNIAIAMGTTPPADAITVIRYVLSKQMLDFAPGTQYNYSNLGFCILGRVIEKITGMKYETYVRDSILVPLGIADAGQARNLKSNKLTKEVTYYDYPGAGPAVSVYDNTTQVPVPYAGFNIEAMDSHGGWVMCGQDLCKFMAAVDGFTTKPDILPLSIVDTMVAPSSTNANYACGWAVNSSNNWWHIGDLPGTTTEIVRGSNQISWALLFNTRPSSSGGFENDMDALVWNVLPKITKWPAGDIFTGAKIVKKFTPCASFLRTERSGIQVNLGPKTGEERAMLTVVDMSGKTILSVRTTSPSCFLPFSNFPAGVYCVSLETGHDTKSEKVLIQH
jgi:CubicO group peptidase (beta-lactamase class C family)